LYEQFYVLLIVHVCMILVNNQLDAQFFVYIYLYSLHVLSSHFPIIRRIIVSVRHLVYVTRKIAHFLCPYCVEYPTTHKTWWLQITCDLWSPCFV